MPVPVLPGGRELRPAKYAAPIDGHYAQANSQRPDENSCRRLRSERVLHLRARSITSSRARGDAPVQWRKLC